MGRTISLIAALILVFCFFLPWVTVSCSGHAVGTVSGQDLASGLALNALGSTEHIEGQPILFLIPLTGVLALIIALISGRTGKAAAVVQILAGLIAGVMLFLTYSNMQSQVRQYNFDASLEYGYLGSVLAAVGIVVGAFLTMGETPARSTYGSSYEDDVGGGWDDW